MLKLPNFKGHATSIIRKGNYWDPFLDSPEQFLLGTSRSHEDCCNENAAIEYLKDSRQFFNQWEAKPKPIAPCTRYFSGAMGELQVIARIAIGSSRCLLLLWLVGVIALVLVFRQSFENHSKIELSAKLSRLFHVGHAVQNRRSAFSLAWHELFSCKGK